MHRQRAGNPAQGISLEPHLPPEFPGRGINAIGVGLQIAEHGHDRSVSGFGKIDGRSDPRFGLVHPVNASRLGIEGIDAAAPATDVDAAVHDRRLGARRAVTGESECPFQLQPRNVFGRQLSTSCAVKTQVGARVPATTPADPARPADGCLIRLAGRGPGSAAVRRCGYGCVELTGKRFTGQKFGKRHSFCAAHLGRLQGHCARVH